MTLTDLVTGDCKTQSERLTKRQSWRVQSGHGLNTSLAQTSGRPAWPGRHMLPSSNDQGAEHPPEAVPYGIWLSRCEMQLRRARFLSSDCTMCQGARSVPVASNIGR